MAARGSSPRALILFGIWRGAFSGLVGVTPEHMLWIAVTALTLAGTAIPAQAAPAPGGAARSGTPGRPALPR